MNEEMEMTMELEPVEEEKDTEIVAAESSGLGAGLAMLIGSALTLAAVAGGMKLKKMWADRKAGREFLVDEEDCGEYFDDEEEDCDEEEEDEDEPENED